MIIRYHSIRYASWPIVNQRENTLHQTCQLTLCNPIRHACVNLTYMLAGPVPHHVERCLICRCSCNKYTCWPSATATQAPLLFKHAYWLSAAARVLLVGPLLFNHACRSFATQSCMPTGVMLVWCLTISRACWCGA